jgi:hypothetical protein
MGAPVRGRESDVRIDNGAAKLRPVRQQIA